MPSGYAGLQGRICIHQEPPAPNKGLQWLHSGVPSLSPLLSRFSPPPWLSTLTLVQGTGPEHDPSAVQWVPQLWGTQGHVRHSPAPAHCPLAAHTDLLALPRCHVLLQILLQQPRVPCSLQQHSGSDGSATLLDTAVAVPPVPLLPGHGGPFLFTVLVKLARGVQAPLSMAHSEAFPLCSSSRRSSGRPGSAPGNVPGG